jgi:peptidase A4-like protein
MPPGQRSQLSIAALATVGLLLLALASSADAVQTSLPVLRSDGAVKPPPSMTELPDCNETNSQDPTTGTNDNPQITMIEGGGKKYSYALPGSSDEFITVSEPPQGFDPLTASDAELQTWGFPPRASNAAGMEAWRELVGSYHGATFREGCRQTNPDREHGYLGEEFAANWSGYEDTANITLSPRKWHGVFGRFYIPSDHGSCSNSGVSDWVGLGGDHSGRFMQTGTETRNGNYVVAWIEWWAGESNFEYNILNKAGEPFLVEATNYVRMSLYYNYELEEYYVYITNDHTGQTELVQGHIGHQFYDGSTAEWIDEPEGPLLNFGEVNWYNAQTQNGFNEVLPVSAYNYEKDNAGSSPSHLFMWDGSMWNGENWTDYYYTCS